MGYDRNIKGQKSLLDDCSMVSMFDILLIHFSFSKNTAEHMLCGVFVFARIFGHCCAERKIKNTDTYDIIKLQTDKGKGGIFMKHITIELIDYNIYEVNTTWWKQLMSLFLQVGVPFEIRCWREQTDVMEEVLTFGNLSEEKSTAYEVSITGILTDAVIDHILHETMPNDDEQMSKFFTINIGENFCSAHYGKEICINDPDDTICCQISSIFDSLQEYFVFSVFD